MINKCLIGIALTASLGLASAAFAQNQGGGMATSQPAKQAGDMGKAFADRLIKALSLTGDQETRVRQILDTHQQAMKNWFKEHSADLKAAREKLQEARKSGDKTALQTAREQLGKVWETAKPLHDALMTQLGDVLNKDQLAKAKELMTKIRQGLRMHEALGKLNLTDDQKSKIAAIRKETQGLLKDAKTPADRVAIRKAEFKKIGDVLTPEQREKLKEMRGAHPATQPAGA